MHRDAQRGYTTRGGRLGGRVRYRQLVVLVSRCGVCRGAHVCTHRWAMAGLWIGLLLGAVAGMGLILVSKSPAARLLGLLVLPAGLRVGAWLGRRLYDLRAGKPFLVSE